MILGVAARRISVELRAEVTATDGHLGFRRAGGGSRRGGGLMGLAAMSLCVQFTILPFPSGMMSRTGWNSARSGKEHMLVP